MLLRGQRRQRGIALAVAERSGPLVRAQRRGNAGPRDGGPAAPVMPLPVSPDIHIPNGTRG